jgi:hypothetical protein
LATVLQVVAGAIVHQQRCALIQRSHCPNNCQDYSAADPRNHVLGSLLAVGQNPRKNLTELGSNRKSAFFSDNVRPVGFPPFRSPCFGSFNGANSGRWAHLLQCSSSLAMHRCANFGASHPTAEQFPASGDR